MDRRAFLKLLLSLPVIGGLGLFASPLLRYLRPSLGPLAATRVDTSQGLLKVNGNKGLFTPGDEPQREKEVVFKLTDFPKVWDSQTFTFGQRSKEFTFKQFQSVRIPGFVVRMPDKEGKLDFSVVSRICPHMGCVFNYILPEQAKEYNYTQAANPLYACPCHLSVYDPMQGQPVDGKTVMGKVVSGPAPRPPRVFEWSLRGDELVIMAVETGGIS